MGAYALAVHGYPRATRAIDLWIRPTPENAECVWRALEKFGAPWLDLTRADLSHPDTVFQIGLPPNRIDIRTGIDGVTFEETWSDRLVTEVDGLKVPVINRAALIRNKRASGRPQDRADAGRLERPK